MEIFIFIFVFISYCCNRHFTPIPEKIRALFGAFLTHIHFFQSIRFVFFPAAGMSRTGKHLNMLDETLESMFLKCTRCA